MLAGQIFAGVMLQSTNENDAVLIRATGEPQEAGFFLVRAWAWVAVDAASGNTVKELVVNMASVTNVTNPKANGKTYTGTFIVGRVYGDDEDEEGTADRHGMIIQEMTKIKNVTGLSDLGTPIKMADKTKLNFMGFEEGWNERVWHYYYYLDPEDRAVTMAIDPTETGYTLTQKEFKIDKQNKTGTYIVLFSTNTWYNISGTSPDRVPARTNLMAYINYDPQNLKPGIAWREEWLASGLMSNQITEARDNMTAPTNYAIDSIVVREQADGEFSLSKAQTRAKGTADHFIYSFQPGYGNRAEAASVWWPLLLPATVTNVYNDAVANAADLTAATYGTAPAGHSLDSIAIRWHDNGLGDVTRQSWKPQSAAWIGQGILESNNFTQVHYTSIGRNLYVMTNFIYRLTQYDALATTAHGNIDDWETEVEARSQTLKKAGTGVSPSRDGWRAQAEVIYDTSGWVKLE